MNKLRIREIFKEREISVSEFAEMLGIERQNVYNIFEKPSWRRLEQCSEVLQVHIRELFEQAGPAEINGYVEYKGKIHRMADTSDLLWISSKVIQDQKTTEK